MDCPHNQNKGRYSRPQGQGTNVCPKERGDQQGGAPRLNRFHALQGRHGVDEVLDVITGMLKVFSFYVYALIELGATLSFSTPFVAKKLHVSSKLLCEPYKVLTLVGESTIPKRLYRNYPLFILHKVLPCDFVELDMVYFDVILRQDLLYAYYASIIC